MRFITDQEETAMRETQASSMNDECSIITNATAFDVWGDPVLTPTVVSGVACGVSLMVAPESRGEAEGHTQIDYDAIIRLPLTVTLAIDSEIRIDDKQDTAISKTYKLTGFPEIGPSAMNVFVEEITT